MRAKYIVGKLFRFDFYTKTRKIRRMIHWAKFFLTNFSNFPYVKNNTSVKFESTFDDINKNV